MNQLAPHQEVYRDSGLVKPITGRWPWDGGGGGEEDPNSLKSNQTARIVDLLSEGVIVGPWNGLRSVYYDGVPVQKDGGGYNYDNFTISGVSGWSSQPVLKGFAQQESEIGVSTQLTQGVAVTRRISAAEVDRCRVTASVPSLMVSKDNGNVKGSNVKFEIWMQANNGGYKHVTTETIDGKTNTRYQVDLMFDLDGPAPWDIRLVRITEDATDIQKQDQLYWDSYTEIIDAKINYTNSAIMAHIVRARDFGAIPERVYDCGGLLIRYPSNYNPNTRNYSGTWDGNFITGFCDNPAWVFMDLLVESRYGIGNFLGRNLNERIGNVDKWELYAIAKWCDQMVRGEPRWSFNGVINTRQEAYDLLANIASVWRGSAFWADGKLVPTCDKPSDPIFLFSNANVIDGRFTYQSADVRARHNQVSVAWNDPTNLGERRLAVVEDKKSITKFGVQDTSVVAMGCTSESMAQRVGEWLIYSENYEGDTVVFQTGLEGAYVRPGAIVKVSDVTVAGKRRSGRITDRNADTIWLDDNVTLRADKDYYVSYVRPNGEVVTIGCSGPRETLINKLNINGTLSGAWPDKDSLWMLTSDDLEATIWRAISAKKSGTDQYEISAVAHNKDKWAYIERDQQLSDPDISNFPDIFDITNMKVIDFLYAMSPISVGSKILVSWESRAPYYDLYYREVDGPWKRLEGISQKSVEFEAEETDYEIWLTPRNELGRRGDTSKRTVTVIGKSAPPETPGNFRVQQVGGVAMFQWRPTVELDVLIGGYFEMRYSPRTDGSATWTSSNTVITSIPGTSTTVELPYRKGTYLIKASDIIGLKSGIAVVVISGKNPNVHEIMKICEHPAWLGTKTDTVVLTPQNWIILATGKTSGYYNFDAKMDIGDVATVRLTVDMLAFPFIPGTGFIDQRTGKVDTWQSWDDPGGDGQGMVTVQMRQTDDDPQSGTANWSEWSQFIGGDYEARGYDFRAWLAAPAGQNVGIEELCIISEVSNKQDNGSNVSWVPVSGKMSIVFDVKFYNVPSISIAIQQGIVGDTYEITNKTKQGFDLRLRDKDGSVIASGARTFDWIASSS